MAIWPTPIVIQKYKKSFLDTVVSYDFIFFKYVEVIANNQFNKNIIF
jgi:hypothetical protein